MSEVPPPPDAARKAIRETSVAQAVNISVENPREVEIGRGHEKHTVTGEDVRGYLKEQALQELIVSKLRRKDQSDRVDALIPLRKDTSIPPTRDEIDALELSTEVVGEHIKSEAKRRRSEIEDAYKQLADRLKPGELQKRRDRYEQRAKEKVDRQIEASERGIVANIIKGEYRKLAESEEYGEAIGKLPQTDDEGNEIKRTPKQQFVDLLASKSILTKDEKSQLRDKLRGLLNDFSHQFVGDTIVDRFRQGLNAQWAEPEASVSDEDESAHKWVERKRAFIDQMDSDDGTVSAPTGLVESGQPARPRSLHEYKPLDLQRETGQRPTHESIVAQPEVAEPVEFPVETVEPVVEQQKATEEEVVASLEKAMEIFNGLEIRSNHPDYRQFVGLMKDDMNRFKRVMEQTGIAGLNVERILEGIAKNGPAEGTPTDQNRYVMRFDTFQKIRGNINAINPSMGRLWLANKFATALGVELPQIDGRTYSNLRDLVRGMDDQIRKQYIQSGMKPGLIDQGLVLDIPGMKGIQFTLQRTVDPQKLGFSSNEDSLYGADVYLVVNDEAMGEGGENVDGQQQEEVTSEEVASTPEERARNALGKIKEGLDAVVARAGNDTDPTFSQVPQQIREGLVTVLQDDFREVRKAVQAIEDGGFAKLFDGPEKFIDERADGNDYEMRGVGLWTLAKAKPEIYWPFMDALAQHFDIHAPDGSSVEDYLRAIQEVYNQKSDAWKKENMRLKDRGEREPTHLRLSTNVPGVVFDIIYNEQYFGQLGRLEGGFLLDRAALESSQKARRVEQQAA